MRVRSPYHAFACGEGLRPRDLAGGARGAGGQPARVGPSQQCVVGGNQGLRGPPHPPSPHLSPTWGAVDAGSRPCWGRAARGVQGWPWGETAEEEEAERKLRPGPADRGHLLRGQQRAD